MVTGTPSADPSVSPSGNAPFQSRMLTTFETVPGIGVDLARRADAHAGERTGVGAGGGGRLAHDLRHRGGDSRGAFVEWRRPTRLSLRPALGVHHHRLDLGAPEIDAAAHAHRADTKCRVGR